MKVCPTCDIPLDAGLFDQSGIFNIFTENARNQEQPLVALAPGDELELARFELSPETCGTLLYFSQFTDRSATNQRHVHTPGYQWSILSNGVPLAPWLSFDHVINPWGMAGFPLGLRLEANSVITFTIRNTQAAMRHPTRLLRSVGGRIVGRFWFDPEHGGPRALQAHRPWEYYEPTASTARSRPWR